MSALALVLLTLLATFAPAAEPEYDLVIRNGRVVDGTGNPWFYGDVAIRGDRIVAVGRVPDGQGEARRSTPRAWSSRPASSTCTRTPTDLLLEDGNAQSKIRQGVTTEVLGEGSSAGPAQGQAAAAQGRRATGKDVQLDDARRLLRRAREGRHRRVNVATYVGLGQRLAVRDGQVVRPADAGAVRRDEGAARRGDEGRGARPVDHAGDAARARWPRPTTSSSCARSVQKHGGLFSSHIRNEGTGVFDAVNEAIAVGERAGVPVDIIHLKIADQKLWGRMNEIVALIDAARTPRRERAGQRLPVHPRQQQPGEHHPAVGPRGRHRRRCSNGSRTRAERERLKKDIRTASPAGTTTTRPSAATGRGCSSAASGSYEGLTMDRVIAARIEGQEPAARPARRALRPADRGGRLDRRRSTPTTPRRT